MLATTGTTVSQDYRKALETVRLLSVREQLALIAEVAVQLRQQMAAEPRRRSILELRRRARHRSVAVFRGRVCPRDGTGGQDGGGEGNSRRRIERVKLTMGERE